MSTENDHQARPRTAAHHTPQRLQYPNQTLSEGPPAPPNPIGEDEDDEDVGMFSFLPPELARQAQSPAIEHTRNGTSSPFAFNLDHQHGFEHLPRTGVPRESEPTRNQPPSLTLSPAAAYDRAASYDGQERNDTESTTRRRGAWRYSETPDGSVVSNPDERPRAAERVESRRTSEGSSNLANKSDPQDWNGSMTVDGAAPPTFSIASRDVPLREFEPQPGSDDFKPMPQDVDVPLFEDDIHYDEEEDSPFPEVRASVSNYDDPSIPCFTVRTVILGLFCTTLVTAANTFLSFRYPAPLVTPIVVQLLTYPCGQFLAWVLPETSVRLPKFISDSGVGEHFTLNPGPFNIKEHTVLVMIANIATAPAYALNFIVAANKFYNINLGVGFEILLVLTTQMTGFGVAGLCRRYLVWPAAMIWPQNLVYCTLLNTLHAEYNEPEGGRMSRYRFLCYVFLAAFCWYFLPGFLFQALSAFNFVCWAAPNNVVVNQLFGISSGLGMSLLTFDWSQISFLGSPLVVPWWAIANVAGAFIGLFWVLAPITYYTNVWDTAFLPLVSSAVFDRFGAPYNTTSVLDKATLGLNVTAYEGYSPLYLPVTYALSYGVGLMAACALIVHTVIYHGPVIYKTLRSKYTREDDIHMKMMQVYREVPDWWYLIFAVIALGLSICTVAAFDTQMPVWGVLLALAVACIYVLPGGFVFALANLTISINLITQIAAGYLFPGKPLANMLFKTYGAQSLGATFSFVSDMKLAHYQKVPPRVTFWAQLISTFLACFVQVGIERWLVAVVPDFCSPTQSSLLICPGTRVFYSSSIVWGLIGPQRILGAGAYYSKLLWWLLAGALAPVLTFLVAKRFPNSPAKYMHVPIALVGIAYIPPSTGINYSSWIAVGFIFQYLLRRKRFMWWYKYNFVLSAGLDSGTIISAIVIFLALSLPRNGTIFVDWWGNNVFAKTLDFAGVSYKIPPEEGFGRTTWN